MIAKTFNTLLKEKIEKFNPYHDARGRFATSGAAASFTIRTKDPSKQHMADMAIARMKEGQQAGGGADAQKRISVAEDELRSILMASAEVKLTGMAPELAESTVASVKMVLDRYPGVKDAFGGFTTEAPPPLPGRSGIFAPESKTMGAYNNLNKTIYLNPNYFGDKEKFEALYKESVEKKFHPEGTGINSVVVHEMGHAIDRYVSENVIGGEKFWWQGDRVSRRLWNNDINAAKRKGETVTSGTIRDNLSGYASKNHEEYLAEGFAEYLTSPSPRKTATSIGKRMETYIKKLDK